jgi:hypothetical protein
MNSHEVNLEGKRRVEEELLKRGAASVTFIGKRKTLLSVESSKNGRTVEIYVKTKRKGSWHTKIEEAKPANSPLSIENESSFWVFVELSDAPRYWIVPDRWIRNDIHVAHQRYLDKHGGHRPQNDASNHHSIEESRIEQWQGRWEVLGIF